MDQHSIPRALTHDEQKAAEAAFAGRPFNPAWSASARKVYEGLMQVLSKRVETDQSMIDKVLTREPADEATTADRSEAVLSGGWQEEKAVKRSDAIRAGFLIDVTEAAKAVGLSFPVSVTKSLWDIGITAGQILPENERAGRLRDVLMAFRLRLANHTTLSPLIDFPALLSLPAGSVPQPIPLFALVQPDEQYRAMVTLLLPNEVSTTIIPMN